MLFRCYVKSSSLKFRIFISKEEEQAGDVAQ